MFFRIHSDGVRHPVSLEGHFAGPTATPCWIIGGGPSLNELPCDRIQLSACARFAVNLCGHGRVRPNFWTAYDPTIRFHRSVYLDASIVKLLPSRRATDVVPETTCKVGDCPNTVFFERDNTRGFHDFPCLASTGICDWQDSLVQAIDLAWRLGFRRLFLAGCDMHIRPSEEHLRRAELVGVRYQPEELLRGFYDRCRTAGLDPAQCEQTDPLQPYHFDETKSLAAAMQTDFHYFRVAQYLRLSRRAMGLAGLELVSVTPNSRLNAFFPYRPAENVLDELDEELGSPVREPTRGQYSRKSEQRADAASLMKDFRPHHWDALEKSARERQVDESNRNGNRRRLQAAIEDLPEIEISLDEDG